MLQIKSNGKVFDLALSIQQQLNQSKSLEFYGEGKWTLKTVSVLETLKRQMGPDLKQEIQVFYSQQNDHRLPCIKIKVSI